MEGEREKVRDQTEGSGEQQPIGQDSPKSEAQPGSGSMPRRSMGTRGPEFGQFGDQDDDGQQGQSGTGQADLGSQAGSTLSGHADQQDLGSDQPGSVGGAQGKGFIGAPDQGTDEYLQEPGSSERATEGTDFAPQGRGALEGEEEDVESGQRRDLHREIETE